MDLGDCSMDTQDETSSTDSGLNVNNNNMVSTTPFNNNMLPELSYNNIMLPESTCISSLPGHLGSNVLRGGELSRLARTNSNILCIDAVDNATLVADTQNTSSMCHLDNGSGALTDYAHNSLSTLPESTQKLLAGFSDNYVLDQQTNVSTTQCNQLAIPDAKEIVSLLQTDNSPELYTTGYELELPHKIKTGDVEKEKMIEDRVKQLGLWNNKRILERRLFEQLSENIDQDGLFQAINRCKRKRRLRDRMDSTSNEIVNTIQPKLVKDVVGNNVSYKVDIIMGLFTHNVRHRVIDHTVTIQGSTPTNRHSKLNKEVTIEFPQNVDICMLEVGFNAGVFRCEAPFKNKRTLNYLSKSFDSVSSAQSEETDSVTSSDLKGIEGVF